MPFLRDEKWTAASFDDVACEWVRAEQHKLPDELRGNFERVKQRLSLAYAGRSSGSVDCCEPPIVRRGDVHA